MVTIRFLICALTALGVLISITPIAALASAEITEKAKMFLPSTRLV